MDYIYGVRIQHIQSYIFETGKLKEIAGASELIEQLCSDTFFNDFLKETLNIPPDKYKIIVKAAGNIQLKINKPDIEKIVYQFPLYLRGEYPGITAVQAVVPDNNLSELDNLLQIQGNRIRRPLHYGQMVFDRAPRTGHPAVCVEDNKGITLLLDQSTAKKRQATSNRKSRHLRLEKKILGSNDEAGSFPVEMSDIAVDDSAWIAVIHADGNNLGHTIKEMLDSFQNVPEKQIELYSAFSIILNKATCNAAATAFNSHIRSKLSNKQSWPFTPILLGGDDLTVICRADLALDFTTAFLENFEKETKRGFSGFAESNGLPFLKNGLTACAGIAYFKSKYPFHYASTMAEMLCADTKQCVKQLSSNGNTVLSALSFHKIQSGFVTRYDEIKKRELTAGKVSFRFGPYGIDANPGLPNITDFTACLNTFSEEGAPLNGLREWLSVLAYDYGKAELILKRLNMMQEENKDKTDFKPDLFNQSFKALAPLTMNSENPETLPLSLSCLITDIDGQKRTPVFDLLTIHSLKSKSGSD